MAEKHIKIEKTQINGSFGKIDNTNLYQPDVGPPHILKSIKSLFEKNNKQKQKQEQPSNSKW